ncbi:MAG TPA: hypothetical protein VN541_19870, partial [Tepidisphaeraceae bacterium]|nr:hypothetical protein [Tepidisphaeraceae bacterium]
RQAELQARYMRGEIDADGLASAGIERQIELDRDLQAALGPAAYRMWDMGRVLEGLNADQAQLSEQERGQVYDLERGLQDALRENQVDKLHGTIDNATSEARQKGAQDQVNQKLQDLLGSRRAGLLEGMDDTLGTVKRAMAGQPLTESQLEGLAAGQRQWDQTRSALVSEKVNTQDPALQSSIQAGAEAWRGKFEGIAGAGTFDDYLMRQDSRYLDLRRNAGRWGIAPGSVDGIFETIQDNADILQAYRQDAARRNVDTATIKSVEMGFSLNADDALRSELGDKAFGDLQANGIVRSW